MFGPLAAIGHGRSGFCELRSGAVDNPGAGRIQALNPGEIEDHALRALRLRDERCGARLQPVAARDNPLARQRQDNPVAAGFFGYGRRSRHQALRPSRNGAHIARPGYCRGQFQGVARAGDQGKNKPSTNRRPRDRDSDSRTKRVESFMRTGARSLQDCRFVVCSPPFPPRKAAGHRSAERAKRQRISQLPNHRAWAAKAAQDCRTRRPASSLVGETLLARQAPCPDPGRGRRDRGQTGPESATRGTARFVPPKAIRFSRARWTG